MTDSNDRHQEKATVQEAGAKGGKARAANMTAEERREAAQRAAQARWQMEGKQKGIVVAPHNGVIKIPGTTDIAALEIPCSVLADGTRVLSERGVAKVLGMMRSGGTYKRSKEAAEDGAKLPIFVAQINLSRFVDLELASVLKKPIWYKPATGIATGKLHKGMRAELLPRICNVWLRARDAGVVRKSQWAVVANADIISRGLAEVGIVALVDEATGFQDVRARDALAKILEQFVAKAIQPYLSGFPVDFFKELCRLKNVPFRADMRLPRYFGKLVNNLAYDRLAPGVRTQLKRVNPVMPSGRRKDKNYQWLTPTGGHPTLLQMLGSEVTLMRMSPTWDDFKPLVDKFHPVYMELPLFDRAEKEGEEDNA